MVLLGLLGTWRDMWVCGGVFMSSQSFSHNLVASETIYTFPMFLLPLPYTALKILASFCIHKHCRKHLRMVQENESFLNENHQP